MRLFAAIPAEGEIRQALQALLERCRATDWPVKWVRPEGLHLTVKFLGEVGPGQVPALESALAAAATGGGALGLALQEVGAFPTLHRARVLYAGLAADPGVELLVDRVERACGALGFASEGRPFRPHVTLGRLRDGTRLRPEALEQLEHEAVAGQSVAGRLVLYQSHTLPGGASYAELATFPLGS